MKINPQLVKLYIMSFGALVLLSYSTLIYYKNEVVEEHIQFLQLQIPILKTENGYLWKEIRKKSGVKKSILYGINELAPFINFLNDDSKPKSIENLQEVNSYLISNFATPDFLNNDSFSHLIPSYQFQLEEYRIVKFQNDLLLYLVNTSGGAVDILERDFSILDFWSKEKYYIYLNYHPKGSFQTNLKINGDISNDNGILFKPERSGLHTLDISLSQFDPKGVEQKLNFQKEIMVLP